MSVDVVIPTIEGREALLERAVASYERFGRVIVIRNQPTCGAAWMKGLARSHADYVHLTSDDIECRGDFEPAIAAVDEGHLPCPRIWTETGALESAGGDMDELHHIIRRHQRDRSPVDYTTVPFMGRHQVHRIGLIPTHYACDVWVSYRGRQLGYETVLVHGYELEHHHAEVGRGAGMTQADRDRVDCAEMYRRLELATA